jgi:hypothetical protein
VNSNRETVIRRFLRKHGIIDEGNIARIVGGFTLEADVYTHLLEKGDRIFQFMRNEELERPIPQTGNWFCLAGATMDALAIFGGGAGRRRQEFVVNRPIEVLEGTAASLRRDWSWAGGGRGGGTQIFVPWHSLFALDGLGTHQH